MAPVEGQQSRICSMVLFPRSGSAPEKALRDQKASKVRNRLTESFQHALSASYLQTLLSSLIHYTPCFPQDPFINLLSSQYVLLNASQAGTLKIK